MDEIIIKGARQHNLKNIDVRLPRDKIIVITGLSGSGKSTLAFDTIYAEGQRRYVESLSSYARQFLGLMQKPDVDSIEGLSPAISIDQKTTSRNPRSTVGTVTEIYDHLRLLYARIGIAHCPDHGIEIAAQSPQKIAETIAEEAKKSKSTSVTILSPLVQKRKGTYEKLISDLNKDGFSRVRVNGVIYKTDEKIPLDRYKMHDIEIVIDRLESTDKSRLAEAVEKALKHSSDGLVKAITTDAKGEKETISTYSSKMACPKCGLSFEELQPRMFSFNNPFGACEECHGLGVKFNFDEGLIIPDRSLSISEGAIGLYRNIVDGWRKQYLDAVGQRYGFSSDTPINKFTKEQLKILMYGSSEKIRFHFKMNQGESEWSHSDSWEGLIPQSERLYKQTQSDYRKQELEKFMRTTPCPVCEGKRLKKKILAVTIKGKSIVDVTDFSIENALEFFRTIELSEKETTIAKQVMKEILSRLEFLEKVGLGYLSLSRHSDSLSGGEAQRIRLATQIGTKLMGVLYILDEPSIGLHQRDNKKLIETLVSLKELGNTLIVVEHDEDTIRSADHVIDMGPGAGKDGGRVVAQGTPEQICKNKNSLTGQYLSGALSIPVPTSRRSSNRYLRITKCRENNLKNIDVKMPLQTLNLITGVSGSGKSTLIYEILYKSLMNKLNESRLDEGKHEKVEWDGEIDKVIVIDQSPIGRTPRSNPATYTKVFDEIRNLFAMTKEARERGYSAGRFSFNVKGGRCEACQGDGLIKIEMNFLPDVYVECEECKGTRFNKETLEVKYKGKSISDVLNMSVDEAYPIFENIPRIHEKLETLQQVGLSYIHLGQSSTTLSGGEAQRIKLTKELSKRATGNTIYLLDEPTTGLHFHDVKKLIDVLQSLVDKKNTVVVIEHNLDVIKSADFVLDLGPEGGDKGGEIIAAGTPEEVAANKKSYTGQFLKDMLAPGKKRC